MNYYYPQYSDQPHQPQTASYYQIAPDDFELRVRQQPRDALLAVDGREKMRKPIDPPPFVEVTVRDAADPIRQYLQSPYLFMICALVPADTQYPDATIPDNETLSGATVSSLNKLKDTEGREGGFCIFADISVKRVGEHRLMFSLFDMPKDSNEAVFIKSILSDVFTVHPQKEYPGLEESTPLSKTFADQGVRIRTRKEARNGGSSRKRTFGQVSQAQSGPSRPAASAASRTPATNYDSSPTSGLARSPSKRIRGDDTPYSGYSRPLTTEGHSNPYGGMPETYGSPPASRLQQPSSGDRNRWFHPQIPPTSQPGGTADFAYRSNSLPQLDPTLTRPTTGMYPAGAVQGGVTGPSAISPTPSQGPYSYGGIVGGYHQYHQPQSYDARPDTGYASQTGMYSGDSSMPPSQYSTQPGYSGSFDNTGRSGYHVPSTSRGWQS